MECPAETRCSLRVRAGEPCLFDFRVQLRKRRLFFPGTDPRLASYQPERVWANEIGARLDWFDQRLERLCLRGGASHSDSGDYGLPDTEHTHDHPSRHLE